MWLNQNKQNGIKEFLQLYLEPQQVVHSTDYDVYGGGAASLGAQVVLEI